VVEYFNGVVAPLAVLDSLAPYIAHSPQPTLESFPAAVIEFPNRVIFPICVLILAFQLSASRAEVLAAVNKISAVARSDASYRAGVRHDLVSSGF
jgi:hypothetical protein